MKMTAITKENIEGFRNLMLPEVAAAIEKGEDVGALGLYRRAGSRPVAVGAIVGLASNGVFQIISLFVEKQYRGQGAGKQLMDSFARGAESFELPLCMDFLSTTEEHAALEGFLTHLGFEEVAPLCPVVRVALADLNDAEIAEGDEIPILEGVLEEISEKVLLLTVPEVRASEERMGEILSTVFRSAKKQYPGDAEMYVYVTDDCVGNFIGRSCRNPGIVSKRYMR